MREREREGMGGGGGGEGEWSVDTHPRFVADGV